MRNHQIAERLANIPQKELELIQLVEKHTDPGTGRIDLQELENDPALEGATEKASLYAESTRRMRGRLLTRMA